MKQTSTQQTTESTDMPEDTRTLYEVLDVDEDAAHVAIKAAYRTLAKRHHPDAGGDAAEFERVQHAAEVLLDGKRRDNYDRHGDCSDVQMHAMPEHEQLVLGIFAQAVDLHIANGLQGANPFEGTRSELHSKHDEALAAIADATLKLGNAQLFCARLAADEGEEMRKFLSVAQQIEHTLQTLIERVEEDAALLIRALAFLEHAKGEDLYPHGPPSDMMALVAENFFKGMRANEGARDSPTA